MARPDLLLVRPPGRWRRPAHVMPPLGLLYVAAAARRQGHRVAVLDAPAEGLDAAGMRARVRAARPRVIGLTAFGPTLGEAADACAALAPHADAVIVGGPQATALGEPLLDALAGADALIIGEGERSVGPAIDWLGAGARGAPPPGVLARGTRLRRRAREHDLDRLAPPAYDLVDARRYRYPLATRRRVSALISGRGCPHRCTFCDQAVTGHRPRLHSPARVVAELSRLTSRLGRHYAVFYDDAFAIDRDRVRAICGGIRDAGLDVAWKAEARADQLDRPLLEGMRAAGCRCVAIGVESASDASLARLRKDLDTAALRGAFAAARAAGVDTVAYALVGLPGETLADALRTARFCRELGARWVQFSTPAAFPGTALHAEAVREGWLTDCAVRNPADGERRRPTVLAPPWTEASLRRALWRCHAAFYLHPRPLVAAARRPPPPRAWPGRLRAGAALGRWLATAGSGKGR